MRRNFVLTVTFVNLILISLSMLVGLTISSSSFVLSSSSNENVDEPEVTPTSLDLVVLVNSSIYDGVSQSLVQYEKDLEGFGFEDVIVLNWSEGSPQRIRSSLQQFYSSGNLAGALLVGDLPAVEYEMFTVWDYERFPMDLYYMDLDGNWTDSDGDGILDRHFGKVSPEIWVGRIKASNLEGDEVSLINAYFEKNHRYRIGSLSVPRRSLLYIDDDWANYASMDSESLGLLYDAVTNVTDKATTNATDYISRLKEGYEWVHVRAHGSWNRHYFEVPAGDGGVIFSQEYAQINPAALFYQLFVCSAARFTEPNYLAGEIVFNSDHSLMAIGSTKTGGMLMFWTFYEALARGRNVGDAFKEWFVKWGEGKVSLSGIYMGRKWFYGLTLIGDPTLRLRWLGEEEIAELQKREEEAVDDLPLVQDLREQIFWSESNYSSLYGDYSDLRNLYLDQQSSYSGLTTHLVDIRNLLYFFLLVTAMLVVSNVYLIRSKSRNRADYSGRIKHFKPD